jgi:ketosteroid isomerase-like protein
MTFRLQQLSWVLVLACAAAPCGAQTRAGQSDQQILVQLEKDWDVAFLHKDIPFIEKVLADEYVVTYDDGARGDRAKELALDASFSQPIDSSDLDGFAVKVYGDTALVWFTRHLVGPTQAGPARLTMQFLDVFVWRAGRWQCVASQSTKID